MMMMNLKANWVTNTRGNFGRNLTGNIIDDRTNPDANIDSEHYLKTVMNDCVHNSRIINNLRYRTT